MKLHLNKQLFRQAIQFTSDQLQIPAIYIEKDYWVTFVLHIIFNDPIGKDTVFKGGTALSKCFEMISRFSEDIDLVVIRREGESNNKLTSKIKVISELANSEMPEINIEGLTHKMGMNRKTAHSYNKEFKGEYGQVRDAIVIEATWLGYHEPYSVKAINSMVGKMMMKNGQLGLAEEYSLLPFELNVLDPTRTVCEKIMSLVRFSYGEDAIENLKKKIRHAYDLHQLLQVQEFFGFFNSPAFVVMLLKVAEDDVISYKNNNQWLSNHPNEALIFKQLEQVWEELEPVYSTDFKNLVYGNLPTSSAVLDTMRQIKERLRIIDWQIIMPKKQD